MQRDSTKKPAPLLDLLFPRLCVLCGQVCEWPGYHLCPKCYSGLRWLPEGTPPLMLERDLPLVAAMRSSDNGRALILRCKRRSGDPVALMLTGELCRRLAAQWDDFNFTAVTETPMAPRQRRARGFNHAHRLARDVAREFGVPHFEGLLCELDGAAVQHTLDVVGRHENAMGYIHAAVPPPKCAAEAAGHRVLLVDDIVTSGATLIRCAHLLRGMGAQVCAGAFMHVESRR